MLTLQNPRVLNLYKNNTKMLKNKIFRTLNYLEMEDFKSAVFQIYDFKDILV